MAFEVCPECKHTTGHPLILDPSRNKNFCQTCFFQWNPPIFILIKPWYVESLYSPRRGKNVLRTLEGFKKCGFQVFNMKQALSIDRHPRAEKIITMKYRGKKRCIHLRKDYKHWPFMMQPCNNPMCI